MKRNTPWHCAALLSGAALVVACAPDPSQPPAATAEGDAGAGSIRPPTTTPSPAEPGAAAPPPAVPRLMARADVEPLNDSTVRGIVEFQTAVGSSGALTLHVMLMGLDAGPHGMHIHEGTDCTMPGTHLNPQSAPHGAQNAGAAARHLGDLGNITADASGMVEEALRDTQLGGDSTFIGKVVVIHRGQDDLSTQPDGASGEPVACGVIAPVEDVLTQGEAPNRGV